MEKELKLLSKNLKRKASVELKKVRADRTHYEGMCKGLWIAYSEAAKNIDLILRKAK